MDKTEIKLSTIKAILGIIDSRQRNVETWLSSISDKHRNDDMNTRVYNALRGEYIAKLEELDQIENQLISLMANIEHLASEEVLEYFEEIGL